MRAYLVTGVGQLPRYVGTQAQVSERKKDLMAAGLKRKEVNVSEVDIPDDKQGKLDFINQVIVDSRK